MSRIRFLKKGVFLSLCILFLSPRNARAFEFNFFSNVNFSYGQGSGSDANFRNGTFALGQADFFLTHTMEDHFHFLGEFVITGTTASTFSVSAERLTFGYSPNDYFAVGVGRYHTPIGYWNTAYHHGAVLHTSVDHPFFLVFDGRGGLVPLHSVGLMLSGRTKGDNFLDWRAYVANGVQIGVAAGAATGTLDPRNIQDINQNKMVGIDLNLKFREGALEGAQFGLSGVYQRVPARQGNTVLAKVDQAIMATSAVYDNKPFEVIGEYYLYFDKDIFGSAGTTLGHAFYGQFGYTFIKRWTPYVRWEQLRVNSADPYFIRLNATDRYVLLAGLNLKLPGQNVLKFEGRGINFARDKGQQKGLEVETQWAFGF